MKRVAVSLLAIAILGGVIAVTAPASGHADEPGSPLAPRSMALQFRTDIAIGN
jgi:hypothetical protein